MGFGKYFKKIGKAVSNVADDIADAVTDAAGAVKETAAEVVDKAGNAAKWLGNEALDISEQLLAFGFSPAAIQVILAYYGTLKLQANEKWRRLPGYLLNSLQPYFGINLGEIVCR
jgi:hypothetical protein